MGPGAVRELIFRIKGGMSFRKAAARHSISLALAHRYFWRVNKAGAVTQPLSSRPHGHSRAVSTENRSRVIELYTQGASVATIADQIGTHRSTIYRILKS
jgi:transposase